MAEAHANPVDAHAAHDHGPSHGHEHGPSAHRHTDRRALWIAFIVTAAFMVAEAIGGWLSNSLALLSDAGHMLTDAAALFLSLSAIWLAQQPARRRRTYGLHRAEILAAFLNAVALMVICGFIFFEAWQRLQHPEEVQTGLMLAVAIAGLCANAFTFYVMWKSGGDSLNLRGALLHVAGDLLGSVGAIAAALIVRFTGWSSADPLISVLIAILIIFGAWRLLWETLRVLLEIAPPHISPQEVEEALRGLPGVAEVHDVHVWTITSGMEVVSGHLRLTDSEISTQRVESTLQQAYAALERFKFKQITLQIEPHEHANCRRTAPGS
ncbi:MAG TPA: cation diffusion facilitator family transporter [Planctomycetota bacterium]|nr:cation diffusion facilitator family transporter [Planctomycetota bacterium]